MESLLQSDLQGLHEFARGCYALPALESLDQFAPRLVALSMKLIPAMHVVYCDMYPPESESRNYPSTPELATPEASALWARHMHEHPALTHILKTGDHQTVRISDFWSERQMHDSGLHHEVYRPYGIEDVLCSTIPVPLPRVTGIAWHSDRLFSDRERLLAELARAHMNQAWEAATLIDGMQSQLRTLHDGFSSLNAGVVVLTDEGGIQFINDRAIRYLSDYLGLSRQTDHHLPDDLLRWVRHQQALIAGRDAPPVRKPLEYVKENMRLVIRMLEPAGGAALLLMHEERTGDGLADLGPLGLTPRETEVLGWIADGKTNPEIAVILQMHPGTVKKHLEHIFIKLGVETRTAAASLAMAFRHRVPAC